eukprot:GAHX01001596.1.p1 GENE.GAHX01001596.1~~GAHX01001596.1.p1  ORF type:complete len:381 (+),score=66.46 GAHX01001596.1:211-1353(+)
MGLTAKKSNKIYIIAGVFILIITIAIWLLAFFLHKAKKVDSGSDSVNYTQHSSTTESTTETTSQSTETKSSTEKSSKEEPAKEVDITTEVIQNEWNLQSYFTAIITSYITQQPQKRYTVGDPSKKKLSKKYSIVYRTTGNAITIKDLKQHYKHINQIKGYIDIMTTEEVAGGVKKERFNLNRAFVSSIKIFDSLATSIKTIVVARIKITDQADIFQGQGFISLFAMRVAIINPGGHFFKMGSDMNYEELISYLETDYRSTNVGNAAVIAFVLEYQNTITYYSLIIYIFMLRYKFLEVGFSNDDKTNKLVWDSEVWKKISDLMVKTSEVYEKYIEYLVPKKTDKQKQEKVTKDANIIVQHFKAVEKEIKEIMAYIDKYLKK